MAKTKEKEKAEIQEFQKGDRVKCVKVYEDNDDTLNVEGTIINICSGDMILVEFDREIERGHNGHDGEDGKDGHCWYVPQGYLKLLAKKKGDVPVSTKVHIVDIVRHGHQFIIPDGMGYESAIESLKRRMEFEEQEIEVIEEFKTFVWDGALALQKAIAQMFGWADAQIITIAGFFGSQKIKPKMIQIETGVNENTLVPWGRFTLPGITDGYIETGTARKNGQTIFSVRAVIRRKHEGTITELARLTREFLAKESIYKGKAIRMRFRNEDGEQLSMPEPIFLDVSKVNREEIVFSDEVHTAIHGNLFTPIIHTENCRKYKIPLKRGVLLSGTYGVGKTLAAYATAKICEENEWTFLMTERADELSKMVEFAKQYQPAVVFCEDIDRVVEGDRDFSMDEILNIIDGISSKSSEIMVVLTTNNVEKIHQAMLRPGRLDAVINVLPPDAKAVEKLIRIYGRGLIPADSDLSAVSEELKGNIPAVIRECIERAKLYAISDGSLNGKLITITGANLLSAAVSMKNQLDLLNRDRNPAKTPEQVFGESMQTLLDQSPRIEAMDKTLSSLDRLVRDNS